MRGSSFFEQTDNTEIGTVWSIAEKSARMLATFGDLQAPTDGYQCKMHRAKPDMGDNDKVGM